MYKDEEAKISTLFYCRKDYQPCEANLFTTGEGTPYPPNIPTGQVAIDRLCRLKKTFCKTEIGPKKGQGVPLFEGTIQPPIGGIEKQFFIKRILKNGKNTKKRKIF
ncbi:MAG: hypothetical protein A3F82_03250 [Deltaproteobacteria bacterium RIFCSPLOWO2_12_FULL_44_12]|nr:MAG: hypothetical protein A2712_05230 [Deltaproteobacteria bacterium RIFCSPHIGHO2_01_FULL_43_49]OGQ14395.1 MAG: hypothetical protein A3D22_05155 [Deltaproteobacteria bacterium RIFCSPHIGHO2_02_FULL_44_53]OGQ27565.1 MAG: hypothetical protein A3D98_09020 [Deltaproteobacteria bacterium RIFCSPHIGHO2_12_FULL_44_21]OGQ30836.1 MAG: hypothetical protein A2979_01565 [Deltaproteobacteria bacterium RIFCSPLOWO2_01_FULL_45_74]OGQ42517.1 MAG: hypothetical protein A3I70_11090 [Deltaproteobacteria bacterium 